MKNKFIYAVLVALVAFSFTSFAAGWTFDGEHWSFLDKDGYAVANEWKKDGNKYYYLNEDEVMAVDSLIEGDDCYYYVDEIGARVENVWVYTAEVDNDHDYDWLYFGANGKSYDSSNGNIWKTVNGKKYHFTNNVMDWGFLDDSFSMIEESEDAWKSATYYCGDIMDGARYHGWLEVSDDDGKTFIYFDNAGKKVVDTEKVISGVKYDFDSNGKLVNGFVDVSGSVPTNSKYFTNEGMKKQAWFIEEVDDEQYWFYAKKNGELYKNCKAKVNGKYYYFDADGKMLMGFIFVDGDNYDSVSADNMNISEFVPETGSTFIGYAIEDFATGNMLTGKQNITLADGENYTFYFNKDGTPGKQNGYYYNEYGILVVPTDEHKYARLACQDNDGKEVLVNRTGKICGKGTYTDSEYDVRFIIDANKHIEKVEKKNSEGKWEVVE